MTDGYVKHLGFGSLLLSTSATPPIANDTDIHLWRESRIHSGEYFETVAIEIENLIQYTDDEALRIALQHIVDEFLYIQQSYQLEKKPKTKDYQRSF